MCASFGPDYTVVSKLGEGSFAEVFKVRCTRTGNFLAIKRLKKRYRSIEEVNRLQEILALKVLQGHPNIIHLTDIIFASNTGSVAMAFELMDCNVYDLITAHKKPFDEQTTLILIYQLLKAISFIHSKNMFHRDIKPENCMVDRGTFVLKLCDFGSTRGIVNSSSTPYTEYVSTRWYRAPECILTSGSYGKEVDEWAVGCMLYELLTTRPLFPGKHEIDQITRIHKLLGSPAREVLEVFKKNPNNQISFAFQHQKPTDLHYILPRTSNETVSLLQQLLIYDPARRIEAQDALKMPAFLEIRNFESQYEKISRSGMVKNLPPFPTAYLLTIRGEFQLPAMIPQQISQNIQEQDNKKDNNVINNEQEKVVDENAKAKRKIQFDPSVKFSTDQESHQKIHSPPPNQTNHPHFAIQPNQENNTQHQRLKSPPPKFTDNKPSIGNQKVQFKNEQITNEVNNSQVAQPKPILSQKPNQISIKQNPMNTKPKIIIQPNYQQQPPQPSYPMNQAPIIISKPQITHPYQPAAVSILPSWKKAMATKASQQPALLEARLQAAKRIHEYNLKQQQIKSTAKKQQPFHGAAYQFAQRKYNQGFQKPRPDLIQPRLPKIIL